MSLSAICGVLGGGQDDGPILDPLLNAMADYGPQRRTRTSGRVRLGCRYADDANGRASALAVDRSAGLVAVADARLDERDALCDALAIAHPSRAGLADAELLLRAFARWGEACPAHLFGDYAFAVWDARRVALFCACDHMGARPFYYALPDERFIFASNVQALLAAPGVSAALDEAVVAAKLSSMVPDTRARTAYRAVRKLPAGHSLVVQLAAGGGRGVRLSMVRHWRPEEIPPAPPASDDDYAAQCLDLLRQAVRDRLRGGAVGMHLSGGLDSSSIAVLAARELRRLGESPPAAFSWLPALDGAPPKPAHAWEYALTDAVAAQEGLQVFHCVPSAAQVLDVLRLDGTLPGASVPHADEASLALAAAAGVRVLLSGIGGDECVSFNGRGHWQRLLLTGRWRQLATEMKAQDGAWRLLAVYVLGLLHPALHPALTRRRRRGGMRRRWFIDPHFARRTKPLTAPQARMFGVRRTQLRFLRDGRLGSQAEWNAHAAKHGIEYRFPLLDRRLLEFALSLPPEQFRRPGHNRWLMRHALRDVLPAEVCWNRRKDDPARSEPLAEAIAEALPMVRQRILDRTPSRARYVDMPRLLEALDADRFRAAPQLAPLHAALQFLDW